MGRPKNGVMLECYFVAGMTQEIGQINKVRALSGCIIAWSAMTVLGGFANEYWQIAVARLLLGVL